MKQLHILDSTLRDGAQTEGISFSVSDKLHILQVLDDMGVAYIEAGNPSSNPKDMEFFEKATKIPLKHAKLCAFGSTRYKNNTAEEDENVQSLLKANTPCVVIFGKAWDLHIREILKTTPENNLELVYDTVAFFKNHGKEVIFDAEHFFDGYQSNPGIALEVLRAADRAGADSLCLCDTNGGCSPAEISQITQLVVQQFPGRTIGIHCHNDSGCAVANSMLAVSAGATQVQGTFLGIGERCGNTDLSVLIPNLQLKQGCNCIAGELSNLSRAVYTMSEISNLPVPANKPYVGMSAFAHKGGMHIDGVSKYTPSFEHILPEQVGNKRRFLMSEISGRTTIMAKLTSIAPELTRDAPEITAILHQLKDLEHQGYQFESADASFDLLVLHVLKRYQPHFKLIMYKTGGEYPSPNGDMTAYAMLTIEVDGKTETAASLGNGPVNAMDLALRKALQVFFPKVRQVCLTDYKVRVLTGEQASAAKVRVLIESKAQERTWTTIGVSCDIIQASWLALVDSFEYFLNLNP